MDSTLLKGLDLLDRIVFADGPVSVSSLARELDRPKSNIHRSLAALREAGYLLYREEDRRYFPSFKLVQMGRVVAEGFPYRQAVHPYLETLSRQTGESAHFAIRERDAAVVVSSVLTTSYMVSVIPENVPIPWHESAFGIAQVAAMDNGEVDRMLQGTPDRAEAGALVLEARTRGVCHVEHRGGANIFEIAAPIVARRGAPLGAIGISGPLQRFDPDALEAHVRSVLQVAAQVFSEATGGPGASGDAMSGDVSSDQVRS